jgi:hypothetical protein
MSAYFKVQFASDAWLAAARFVCKQGACVGLHVEIAEPMACDAAVATALDGALKSHGHIACKHVAHTIFPEGLWRKNAGGDPERLFELYNRGGGYYDRLRRHRKASNHNDWGTYFQRLSCADFSRRGEGQLTQAIRALRRDAKPAGAIHLHTSLPIDGIRKIGGPCLQIVTVHAKREDAGHSLSACALYRNHDFFQKALGNYVGLGHLLGFLAECSGMSVGALHVISGHAYCLPKKPVQEVLSAFQ